MPDPFPFPPGSLGAQQSGCLCDGPKALDPMCPLHGIAALTALEMYEAERAVWEAKRQRATDRLRWWIPISLLLATFLSIALSEASEMIARAATIGIVVGAATSWLAWNKP